MLDLVFVMCIIAVNLDSQNTETIVTQGRIINSDNQFWTVDFFRSLSEGNYDMSLNTGVKSVDSNNCLKVEEL